MPTEKKSQQVEVIAELLSKCTIAIATDFRGLSMPETTELRRKLREQSVEYRVIKNSLARLAANQTEAQALIPFLEGPTALAFGYGDAAEPAKVLADHIESEHSNLTIKGALLGNKSLSAIQVQQLARLPSKDVLIAQVMGAMSAPIQNLHTVLSAQLRSIATVLTARLNQLEENLASNPGGENQNGK